MKQLLLAIIPAVALLACQWDRSAPSGTTEEQVIIKDPADYESFKNSVTKHRPELSGRPYSEVSDYFFHLVNDSIYAYWKDTGWDFYGMTRTPQEGKIACGYFVTNTLADLGLKIQRIKLAQCASGEMIKVLCTDIHTFSGFKKFEAFMEKQPQNSVFIIGPDYHTGYVVKDSSGCYFLHSNYINRQGVIKEKIADSKALANNKFFMTGSLTGNKKRLEQWIKD